jgi:hypothetical protein
VKSEDAFGKFKYHSERLKMLSVIAKTHSGTVELHSDNFKMSSENVNRRSIFFYLPSGTAKHHSENMKTSSGNVNAIRNI